MHRWILAAIVSTLLLPTPPARAQVGFRVVVNASNPTSALDREQVSKIFFKKVHRWPDGINDVVPVDLSVCSPTREIFSLVMHERTAASISAYWQRMVFSGREKPPPEAEDEQAVLEYVSQSPRAIGYVSSQIPLIAGVKVLEVAEIIYRSEGERDNYWWIGQDAGVIARLDNVFLLTTSRCGLEDAGRLMVLQNRSPTRTVAVTVEPRVHLCGEHQPTHTHTYTLRPCEELDLGCFFVEQGTRERVSLLEVSDLPPETSDTTRGGEARKLLLTARDLLAFSEAEACGAGGDGRMLVISNTHDRETVTATVGHIERFEGQASRHFRETYQLRPGAQQELGCSVDGASMLEVTLVEAELRSNE